jgi:hypothetical protein
MRGIEELKDAHMRVRGCEGHSGGGYFGSIVSFHHVCHAHPPLPCLMVLCWLAAVVPAWLKHVFVDAGQRVVLPNRGEMLCPIPQSTRVQIQHRLCLCCCVLWLCIVQHAATRAGLTEDPVQQHSPSCAQICRRDSFSQMT